MPSQQTRTDPDRTELGIWYEAYRRRQARRLVALLPRDAVRPLYRAAASGRVDGSPEGDPLELLVEHCARLLPLPPFEVWAEDFARYPDAHLNDWDDEVEGPTAAEPLSLAVRSIDLDGVSWSVRLCGFQDAAGWRAFLSFDGPRSEDPYRTAVVFHEADPRALRDRFSEFDAHALGAFLRSSLP